MRRDVLPPDPTNPRHLTIRRLTVWWIRFVPVLWSIHTRSLITPCHIDMFNCVALWRYMAPDSLVNIGNDMSPFQCQTTAWSSHGLSIGLREKSSMKSPQSRSPCRLPCSLLKVVSPMRKSRSFTTPRMSLARATAIAKVSITLFGSWVRVVPRIVMDRRASTLPDLYTKKDIKQDFQECNHTVNHKQAHMFYRNYTFKRSHTSTYRIHRNGTVIRVAAQWPLLLMKLTRD